MARLHTGSRNGAVSTSILEKGSPANAVLAVIMALVMVIGFMPLPGYTAQAYADDDLANGGMSALTDDNDEYNPLDVIPATLADNGARAGDPVTPVKTLGDYEVKATAGTAEDTYEVAVTAVGVPMHYSAEHVEAYWVGIGILAPAGATFSSGFGAYEETETFGATDSTMTVGEKTYYTFYFGTLSTFHGKSAHVAVKAGDGNDATLTVYNLTFEDVALVYDVSVSGEIENGTVVAEVAEADEEENAEPTGEENTEQPVAPSRVLPVMEGEDVILTATPAKGYLIDDDAVTVTGKSGAKVTVQPIKAQKTECEVAQIAAQDVAAAEGEVTLDSKFMFTMPSEPVTVSATFRAEANLVKLKAAIANADAAMKGVEVSEDGTDVFNDKYWVPENVAAALEDAVAAGELLDKTALQEEVDEAAKAIDEATDAFINAKKPGSKGYTYDDVNEALAKAEELLAETKTSADGNDIKDSEYWATAEVKGTFSKAIEDIKAKVKEGSISPKDAYAALEQAVEQFDGDRELGNVDMSGLEEAVEIASTLLEDAVIAENADEVPEGVTFYNEASATELSKAIADAEVYLALGRVVREQVYGATADLETAVGKFVKSGKKGTKARIDVKDATIAAIPDQAYTGEEIKPALSVTLDGKELVEDTDFTVAYDHNTEIGEATATITGVGFYKGTNSAKFNIVKEVKNDISKATFSEIADQPYTGKAIKPAFTATLDGKELKEKTDYTVEYSDNIEIGEATITITGAGDYTGTATTKFNIKTDIAKATIAKIDDQVYTAKPIEPIPSVTLNKKELKKGTDFTVSYANNIEVGTATVTISGAGEYAGKAEATFTITSAAEAAKASMPDLDETAWYMGGDGSRGGYFPGTNTLYLDYTLARGLMSGYTKDGKVVGFGPNNTLKRAQTATVLYRMTHEDITPTTDPAKYEVNKTGLTDVESNQYYTAAVNWAYTEGVMTGYTDDKGIPYAFGPDDPITREQIATTIGRWGTSPKGGNLPKPTKKVTDLYDDAADISTWAHEGAAFCNEHLIMTGIGGTRNFKPKDNAQRCEMAKIIAVTDRLGDEE